MSSATRLNSGGGNKGLQAQQTHSEVTCLQGYIPHLNLPEYTSVLSLKVPDNEIEVLFP